MLKTGHTMLKHITLSLRPAHLISVYHASTYSCMLSSTKYSLSGEEYSLGNFFKIQRKSTSLSSTLDKCCYPQRNNLFETSQCYNG